MPKRYLLVLAALGTLALLVGASADPGEPDRHERRDRDGVWPRPGLSDRHRHLPGPDRLRWRHDHDSGPSSQSAASMTNWPAACPNELAAMAAAAGDEQAALTYGNCFLDLGNAKAGCRSLVVATNNLFLHGHNFDWNNLGGLGRWTTCIIRRNPSDGRFRTVAIGFPGMVGALDIINEKGLALSFNQLGIGKGAVSEPVFVMMRRIAETCSSLEAARKEILQAPHGMPFIITVSDASSAQASIFEHLQDRVVGRHARGWESGCNAAQGSVIGGTRLDQVVGAAQITGVADVAAA